MSPELKWRPLKRVQEDSWREFIALEYYYSSRFALEPTDLRHAACCIFVKKEESIK
jgi:hypothetical protein